MQGSVLGEFSELLCGANLISTHLSHSQPLFPSSKALLHFATLSGACRYQKHRRLDFRIPHRIWQLQLSPGQTLMRTSVQQATNMSRTPQATRIRYIVMLCAKKGLKSTGVRESLLFAITHWASTRSTTQRASQRNFNISHHLIY